MTESAEFERFTDFLARMIEKYGNEVIQEMTANKLDACTLNEREENSEHIMADKWLVLMLIFSWDKYI